jgi:hypothetical protein
MGEQQREFCVATSPTVREFPNPQFYTRESWLTYMTSHSHDPLPADEGYAAHIAEMNAVFDRENADGLLRRDVVTAVYSEMAKPEQKIENFIGDTLTGDGRKNATDFFGYLLKHGLRFERGQGYLADKLYWMVKHNDTYICFILINGGEDKTEPIGWNIWMNSNGSDYFIDNTPDDRVKEIAWKHIDICGNCGGCDKPGGSRKTVFGKEFDNVCITPMRFDNPDTETVECVKKLIEFMRGITH